MTDHPRKQIRDYVFALLDALKTDGVFVTAVKSRVHNFQPDELPGATVYTLRETATRDAVAPKLQRTVSLVVDIRLKGGDDLDDAADELCRRVEVAMALKRRMGGLALDSTLADTTIGLSGEGERRLGVAQLRFDVLYRTNPDATAA